MEGKLGVDWKKIGAIFGIIVIAAFLATPGPVSTVSADTENTTTSQLIVSGVIDVTINASACDFGSHSPGTINTSATDCFPLRVTLHANTNTVTNLQVKGADMKSGGNTLIVNNLTYVNATGAGAPSHWLTELNTTYASGSDEAHSGYNDWLAIPDPAADVNRDIYWYSNVPSYQTKGTYSGTLNVKMVDAG